MKWDDFADFLIGQNYGPETVGQEGMNCPITDVLNDSQIVIFHDLHDD